MIKEPGGKPPFYLLTGLVLGLVLGFILAWLVWPPRVTDVAPSSLAEEYRDQYRLMVALSYASSGDTGRAQARLTLLGDNDPVRALNSQAQLALADPATQPEARALSGLAARLQEAIALQQSTAAALNTPDPSVQSAATPINAAVEGAAYFSEDPQLLCDAADTPPYVKVFIFDANNNPQAGVELILTSSEEGELTFSTGQRPEMSPGYGEAELRPGVVYSLSIQGEQAMGGLQAAACETEAGEPAWGSWLLLFHAEE
ncbi:MAG: hypothetical protein WD751_01495 [Anaerolineales bacterium]